MNNKDARVVGPPAAFRPIIMVRTPVVPLAARRLAVTQRSCTPHHHEPATAVHRGESRHLPLGYHA